MSIKAEFLIPAEGKIIRNPMTKAIIPPAGALCNMEGTTGRFFRARLRDGDLINGKPPVAEKAAPAPAEEPEAEPTRGKKSKEDKK